MKHVIIIESSGEIRPMFIENLRIGLERVIDSKFGDDVYYQLIANQPSAIRGVYRLYSADESKSPDEFQSAS